MPVRPHQHPTFSISAETIVKILFAGVVAFALWQIRSIIVVVLTAVVVAVFVDRGASFLRRLKIPRTIGVILIYLIAAGAIAGILYLFVPVFLDEFVGILDLLPQGSNVSNIIGALGDGGSLKDSVAQLSGTDPMTVVENIRSSLSFGALFQSVSSVFGGIVNFVLMIIISFYLSLQEDGVESFLKVITPAYHQHRVLAVWGRAKIKISNWFRGQLLSAFILSLLTYAGLLIIGVPYALMLSLMAMVFGLIPFGIAIAGLVAIAIAFISGGPIIALIVLGLYTVLQQFENYVLQPIIMRQMTGVPAIVVLISLIIGAKLAGVLGVILAIPVSVLILEIIADLEKRRLAEPSKAA